MSDSTDAGRCWCAVPCCCWPRLRKPFNEIWTGGTRRACTGVRFASIRQKVSMWMSVAFCTLPRFNRKPIHDLLCVSFNVHVQIALGNLGSVLSSQGRYDDAKAALQLALQYRPNMADVHYNL